MALKSSREGLRKELVDYLGNLIIDDNLRNEIIKLVGDNFVTSESLNEAVNNLTMQITTESGERIEADGTLQNNITAEATAREGADTTLQNNINAETTARQEAITNLEALIETSGLKMDLLWTNASPNSYFAPQTLSLDLSNYKLVMIQSIFDESGYRHFDCFVVGEKAETLAIKPKDNIMVREVEVLSSGIRFFDAIDYENGTSTTEFAWATPQKIWGIA